jgi:hypothetical protein
VSRPSRADEGALILEPLQTTLAGEHAAVWVLGVIGAQASEKDQPALREEVTAAYRAHRARRDQLVARVTALGAAPLPAEAAYALGDVTSADTATAAALTVERRSAVLYADLVATTTGSDRTWAVNALIDSAVRQLRFRGSPETFPGTSELAV